MKKMINKKNNVSIKIFISFIFVFFICSFIYLSNLDIDGVFKNVTATINNYIINNMYKKDDFNNNILSSKIKYLEQENNALKESIKLSKTSSNIVMAEIINHNSYTWFDTLNINKGTKENIDINNPVVNNDGLIGFISKTSHDSSEVRLLTGVNEQKLIPVMINLEEKNISGVLCKYDPVENIFIVKDVMYNKEILKGTKVVLSDYYNKLYSGVYIGKVKREIVTEYGLSKTLEIESDVNFHDLLFVGVMVSNND